MAEATRTPELDLFWRQVNMRLSCVSAAQARLHGLGALDAFRRARAGIPVPDASARDARVAALAVLSAKPLLEWVRKSCDGPLVVMKGPEIAVRYPASARGFVDIDLLVPKPQSVHRQLRESGFIEVGDPKLYHRIHHLRPLKRPELPLMIEIHGSPKWPNRLIAPEAAEIVETAVRSDLAVEGILAPERARHALLIAAHAWAHEPLRNLRDLIDVRAMAMPVDEASIERTAKAWGLTRLWKTVEEAAGASIGTARSPVSLRLWARHLRELRERTVLENHLRAWLADYWALPAGPALAATANAIVCDLTPAPDEAWREKLTRVLQASRHPSLALSHHHHVLGDAAKRGRHRNRPDDDDQTSCLSDP